MAFDPIAFKQKFPLFQQPENQSLVYLDNAATSQRPSIVIQAVTDFYQTINANANRSSHRLARAATAMVEKTREKAKDFLNAKTSREVVFTSGATESLNLIAYGLRSQLKSDDRILLSMAEHHANLVPWQETAQSTGTTLNFIDDLNSDWLAKVDRHTKIIALTACSNVTGQLTNLSLLEKIKRIYPDIIIILDASQLVAHKAIDVQSWPCDFLVCSVHKFYGPTGVGLLYGSERQWKKLQPLKVGGEMISRVDLESSEYREGPEKFEAGTSPLAAIAGLNACFEFWRGLDRQAMEDYERQLTVELHNRLAQVCKKNSQISLLTEAENNIGIALLGSNSLAMVDIGHWLDEHDIAVRVGDHCAQPMWRSLGYASGLRISIAAYNSSAEIDLLVEGLNSFFADENQRADYQLKSKDNLDDIFAEQFSSIDWVLLTKNQPWQQRYKKILQLGKILATKTQLRQQEFLIAGCESSTWMSCRCIDHHYFFAIDSESNLVKGLAVLLLCRMQGETAEALQAIDYEHYFAVLGLSKHLSASRVNGFYQLWQAMLAKI